METYYHAHSMKEKGYFAFNFASSLELKKHIMGMFGSSVRTLTQREWPFEPNPAVVCVFDVEGDTITMTKTDSKQGVA